jgi:hypothetical protein
VVVEAKLYTRLQVVEFSAVTGRDGKVAAKLAYVKG